MEEKKLFGYTFNDFKKILPTFLYFFILFYSIFLGYIISQNLFTISESLLRHINIFNFNSLPFFYSMGISLIPYVFLIFFLSEGLEIVYLVYFIPLFAIISQAGRLFPLFFKIKSSTIKVFLIIIPFLLVSLLTTTAIMQASNADAEFCGSKLNTGFQIECYYDLALKEKDPAFCFKIPDGYRPEVCLKKVFSSLNKENLNPDVCIEYTKNCINPGSDSDCGYASQENMRNMCYYALSVVKGDSTACSSISHDYYKNKCYAEA